MMCFNRAKVDALAFFQEGLKAVVVSGTKWDTVEAVDQVSCEIDTHINKLRSQKVLLQPPAGCSLACGCCVKTEWTSPR